MANHKDPYAVGGADDVFVAPPIDPGDEYDFAEPPKWPKVVGIISMIWGGLGLVCGGAGLVWFAVGPRMMQGAAQDLPPMMTQHNVPLMAVTAISVAMSIWLIIAGALSANRKPAARWMHLAWAAISIVLVLINTKLQLDVQAETAQWVKDNPNTEYAKAMSQGGGGIGQFIGLFVGIVLGLAWPIFCIIWFGMVNRRPEQMTGGIESPAA